MLLSTWPFVDSSSSWNFCGILTDKIWKSAKKWTLSLDDIGDIHEWYKIENLSEVLTMKLWKNHFHIGIEICSQKAKRRQTSTPIHHSYRNGAYEAFQTYFSRVHDKNFYFHCYPKIISYSLVVISNNWLFVFLQVKIQQLLMKINLVCSNTWQSWS